VLLHRNTLSDQDFKICKINIVSIFHIYILHRLSAVEQHCLSDYFIETPYLQEDVIVFYIMTLDKHMNISRVVISTNNISSEMYFYVSSNQ